MFDVTSIILMCCFEIIHSGKVIFNVWRLFFDEQLSVILTKLEATHEKMIHLNLVPNMQIKINFLFITGIIVHFITSNIFLIKWMKNNKLLINSVINNNQHTKLFYSYINILFLFSVVTFRYPLVHVF